MCQIERVNVSSQNCQTGYSDSDENVIRILGETFILLLGILHSLALGAD